MVGFNCSDGKMRKLDGRGEVLAACGAIELVIDAMFLLPVPFPTLLSSTWAHTFSGTWRETARKRREVVKENRLKELSTDGVMRSELASPWPSRRGWLHEAVAWIGRGNDGSANAGGPTTSVG